LLQNLFTRILNTKQGHGTATLSGSSRRGSSLNFAQRFQRNFDNQETWSQREQVLILFGTWEILFVVKRVEHFGSSSSPQTFHEASNRFCSAVVFCLRQAIDIIINKCSSIPRFVIKRVFLVTAQLRDSSCGTSAAVHQQTFHEASNRFCSAVVFSSVAKSKSWSAKTGMVHTRAGWRELRRNVLKFKDSTRVNPHRP